MNTPQEFEPLGLWMGWEKCMYYGEEYWVPSGQSFDPETAHHCSETSLTDAECIEALNRLVGKGYLYGIRTRNDEQVEVSIGSIFEFRTEGGFHPTINQAVEQALLKLIAAERGEE